jgi:hypothetical protein
MNSLTVSERPKGPQQPFMSIAGEDRGILYPWFGLVATVVGTVAAVVAVPYDCAPPEALQLPASLSAAGMLLAPLLAGVRDARSFARIENVLASAPVYWLLLDLIQARYGITLASREDVVTSFVACGCFSSGVWLSCLRRPWNLPRFVMRASTRDLTADVAFKAAIACFVIGVFYFLFESGFDPEVVIDSFSVGRWDAAWSRITPEGGWDAFVEHLSYFGMLLPCLAVVIGRRAGWLDLKTITCWVLSISYAAFQAQGGNRRYVGVMFGAAIVVWLLSSHRLGIKQQVIVATWAAGLLVAMNLMLAYRGEGVASVGEEDNVLFESIGEVRVDDNFLRLAQSVHLVPEYEPYVWYDYAWFALIRPVPRVFWPGKPLAPSFRIMDYINTGASLSSSVVGEFYVSGGLLAVLFGGWFYGRLGLWGRNLLAGKRTLTSDMLYGTWLMALFTGCRSMQDLVMMSYVVLALLAVLWVVGRMRSQAWE